MPFFSMSLALYTVTTTCPASTVSCCDETDSSVVLSIISFVFSFDLVPVIVSLDSKSTSSTVFVIGSDTILTSVSDVVSTGFCSLIISTGSKSTTSTDFFVRSLLCCCIVLLSVSIEIFVTDFSMDNCSCSNSIACTDCCSVISIFVSPSVSIEIIAGAFSSVNSFGSKTIDFTDSLLSIC